jgi:hypothetical protein
MIEGIDSTNHVYPRAATPELSSEAFASIGSPEGGKAEAFLDAVADRLMEKTGGSGGDGPIDLKKFRKGNWFVQAVIGILIAGAGALAAYKATEARSIENEKAIEDHADKPMHTEAARRIDKIEDDISDTRETLSGVDGNGGIKADVAQIAKGVDQLKKEAQTEKQKRLEEKVKALERENRKLEREAR